MSFTDDENGKNLYGRFRRQNYQKKREERV